MSTARETMKRPSAKLDDAPKCFLRTMAGAKINLYNIIPITEIERRDGGLWVGRFIIITACVGDTLYDNLQLASTTPPHEFNFMSNGFKVIVRVEKVEAEVDTCPKIWSFTVQMLWRDESDSGGGKGGRMERLESLGDGKACPKDAGSGGGGSIGGGGGVVGGGSIGGGVVKTSLFLTEEDAFIKHRNRESTSSGAAGTFVGSGSERFTSSRIDCHRERFMTVLKPFKLWVRHSVFGRGDTHFMRKLDELDVPKIVDVRFGDSVESALHPNFGNDALVIEWPTINASQRAMNILQSDAAADFRADAFSLDMSIELFEVRVHSKREHEEISSVIKLDSVTRAFGGKDFDWRREVKKMRETKGESRYVVVEGQLNDKFKSLDNDLRHAARDAACKRLRADEVKRKGFPSSFYLVEDSTIEQETVESDPKHLVLVLGFEHSEEAFSALEFLETLYAYNEILQHYFVEDACNRICLQLYDATDGPGAATFLTLHSVTYRRYRPPMPVMPPVNKQTFLPVLMSRRFGGPQGRHP